MNSAKANETKSTVQQQRSTDAGTAVPRPFALGQRLGNQGLGQLLRSRRLQAKLTVSNPNDVYEQEADRVADQVMRMANPQQQSLTNAPVSVQRKWHSCEQELQRSGESTAAPGVDSATEQSISSLSGRGSPLPQSVRGFMEPRFGADFSAVRVHTDANAHSLARSVEAKAFTVGNNVVFGAGHFAPESDDGKRLLAHELAHTIQQRGAAPRIARAPNTENVLRLSDTGEIFTEARLIRWATNQDRPVAELIAEVEASNRFSGNPEVRMHAAEVLRRAMQAMPREERRIWDDMADQARRAQQEEDERKEREKQKVSHKALREANRRRAWLAGHGSLRDKVLERAAGPVLLPGGFVSFGTYDSEGTPIVQWYANVDAYRNSIREQLKKVWDNGEELPQEVSLHVARDDKALADTLEQAAWYQLPGLLMLPGVKLGYSEEAREHGRTAGAYALKARNEAGAALQDLERNGAIRAGERLNKARFILLQAKHSLQAMLRTQDKDNEASLGHLQSYSTAGEAATIPMSPWAGVVVATFKNGAWRMSRSHTDGTDFGAGAFFKETAITIGSMKLQQWAAGPNPGFLRAAGTGFAVNQAGKVLLTGDVSQILEVNRTELLLMAGGFGYGLAQARMGQPLVLSTSESQAPPRAPATPEPNSAANAGTTSQDVASVSQFTYEQSLLVHMGQGQPAPASGLENVMEASASSGASQSALSSGSAGPNAPVSQVFDSSEVQVIGFGRTVDQMPPKRAAKRRRAGFRVNNEPEPSDGVPVPGSNAADATVRITDPPGSTKAAPTDPTLKVPAVQELELRVGGFTRDAERVPPQVDAPELRVGGFGREAVRVPPQALSDGVPLPIDNAVETTARVSAGPIDATRRMTTEPLLPDLEVGGFGREARRVTPQVSPPPRKKVHGFGPQRDAVPTAGPTEVTKRNPNASNESPDPVPEGVVHDDGWNAASSRWTGEVSDGVPEYVGHDGTWQITPPGRTGDSSDNDLLSSRRTPGSTPVPRLPPNAVPVPQPPPWWSRAHRLRKGRKKWKGNPEALDEVVETAVAHAREALSHELADWPYPVDGPIYLDQRAMQGGCGFGSKNVAESLKGSDVSPRDIYVNQAADISGNRGRHMFVVWKRPDGVVILIDATFAQFTGQRLNSGVEALLAREPGGVQLRSDLMQKGYTVLTDEVANLYLRAVCGASEVPPVNVATFMRDAANLLKHPELLRFSGA